MKKIILINFLSNCGMNSSKSQVKRNINRKTRVIYSQEKIILPFSSKTPNTHWRLVSLRVLTTIFAMCKLMKKLIYKLNCPQFWNNTAILMSFCAKVHWFTNNWCDSSFYSEKWVERLLIVWIADKNEFIQMFYYCIWKKTKEIVKNVQPLKGIKG